MDINSTNHITLFPLSKRGIRLIQQSWPLLKKHPVLLCFSFIIRSIYYGIFSGVLLLSYLMLSKYSHILQVSGWEFALFYTAILITFFIANLLGAFMQATLNVTVMDYQQDKHPSLYRGISAACRRFWPLFLWLLFISTAGVFIAIFQKKLMQYSFMYKLLNGVPWHKANYFAYPVIMHTPCGALQAIRRSSQLMRDYAGENPKFNFSFSLAILGIRLIAMIPLFISLYLNEHYFIVIGSAISILSFLLISAFLTVVQVIIHNAIYEMMISGKIPIYFKEQDIKNAFTR